MPPPRLNSAIGTPLLDSLSSDIGPPLTASKRRRYLGRTPRWDRPPRSLFSGALQTPLTPSGSRSFFLFRAPPFVSAQKENDHHPSTLLFTVGGFSQAER